MKVKNANAQTWKKVFPVYSARVFTSLIYEYEFVNQTVIFISHKNGFSYGSYDRSLIYTSHPDVQRLTLCNLGISNLSWLNKLIVAPFYRLHISTIRGGSLL